jgi:histidinol-phosphatase (PHP family)
MFYTDYHCHTQCSPDSEATLDGMAEAAIDAGLSEFCVTDHCDLCDPYANRISSYDWTPALSQYELTRSKFSHRLNLKFGIELGSAHICVQDALRIISVPQLDFIIGSNHNWSESLGGKDFYFTDYTSLAHCYQALDDYFEGLAAIASLPECYDVLGHIIYPLRYMCGRDGQAATLENYMERIESLLKTVIGHGRGIEMNTYRGKSIEEWGPILARYQDLGGEIITVGSDAHVPKDMGGGVKAAYELLSSMGFRYISTYEKRKPNFIKL